MANVKNININNTDYNIVDAQSAHKIAMDPQSPKTLLIKNYVDTTLGYVNLPTGASIVPGTWSDKSGNVYTSFTYNGAINGDIIAIAPGDVGTYALLEYSPTGRNIGDIIDLGGGYCFNRTAVFDTQRTTYLIQVNANRYMNITDYAKSIYSYSSETISSIDNAIAAWIKYLGSASYMLKGQSTTEAISLYDSSDALLTPTSEAAIYGTDGREYLIKYFSSPVTPAYAKLSQFPPYCVIGMCGKFSGTINSNAYMPMPGIMDTSKKWTPIYTPSASNLITIVGTL